MMRLPAELGGLLICRNAKPSGLDQFDCGADFGLIPDALGAYSRMAQRRRPINPQEFVSLRTALRA